jgi:type III pantothenate kinase
MPLRPLIAVDIGNARIKFGRFSGGCAAACPEPTKTLALTGAAPELDAIGPWLSESGAERQSWWIASVNRPAATRLIDWVREHRPDDSLTLLAAGDLPLEVGLERPDMVGVDRLVDAVAVNRLRDAKRSAVIVDVGTAITVDLVSGEGVFLGGAILPGLQMSARAMHEFTDLLPLIDMSELTSPPSALGTDTLSAMESGLFWGAVGAVRQLTERLASVGGSPQVFLTGGAAEAVAELLGPDARYVSNLTLAGIALSAWEI